MNKIALVKRLLLLVSIVFFVSCDKEFNTIGSDIVGQEYFQFEKDSMEVSAANLATGPVQTNNLPVNSLGVYNNPTSAFGPSVSHFVTQVELPFSNVTVNSHPVVDSAWVYIPFYSHQTGTDDNGIRKFELDSVFGADPQGIRQKFRLKVYENGYYLGSYNPNNENGTQYYYSDDKDKIENKKLGYTSTSNPDPMLNGHYLNDSAVADENEQFFFNKEERIIYKTDGNGGYLDANGDPINGDLSKRVVKERFAPGIWLNLNKDYFRKRILEAPADKLTNNNTFKEYFRGLYFQVEALNGMGAMAMLDFSKGYIRITYNTDDVEESPTPTGARLEKELQMKLGGNCINFFDNNYTLPSVQDKLYLKGGNGSVAYIDLFGTDGPDEGNTPDGLDALRNKGWMINEANLTFYVDQDNMVDNPNDETSGYKEAKAHRLYLYDFKNSKPILDYMADISTNSANPKYNKRGYGGIIEKDASGKGVKYKVRITEYLKNLIKHTDSTNYRLGVVVSENINIAANAYLKPASGQQPGAMLPLSSVLSPAGTILHGSNIAPGQNGYKKRLKLEIYFTKPD